jgi:hypothetical protein
MNRWIKQDLTDTSNSKSRPNLQSSEKWTIFSIGLRNRIDFAIVPLQLPLSFYTEDLPTFYNSKYTPRTSQNSKICPQKFFHPHLFNRNSKSGDSCANILIITSSFFSSCSYAYDCCICLIVCLSIMRTHSRADDRRIPRSSIQGLQSFL